MLCYIKKKLHNAFVNVNELCQKTKQGKQYRSYSLLLRESNVVKFWAKLDRLFCFVTAMTSEDEAQLLFIADMFCFVLRDVYFVWTTQDVLTACGEGFLIHACYSTRVRGNLKIWYKRINKKRNIQCDLPMIYTFSNCLMAKKSQSFSSKGKTQVLTRSVTV